VIGPDRTIAGTEDHPHARMSLATALTTGPSHAYLFHGPAGVGKRTAARAFAAELLARPARRSSPPGGSSCSSGSRR
jgi:DNA polymerase III delta prime subunit